MIFDDARPTQVPSVVETIEEIPDEHDARESSEFLERGPKLGRCGREVLALQPLVGEKHRPRVVDALRDGTIELEESDALGGFGLPLRGKRLRVRIGERTKPENRAGRSQDQRIVHHDQFERAQDASSCRVAAAGGPTQPEVPLALARGLVPLSRELPSRHGEIERQRDPPHGVAR